jgi:hypothetical protein
MDFGVLFLTASDQRALVFCKNRRASCVEASIPSRKRVRLGGPVVAADEAEDDEEEDEDDKDDDEEEEGEEEGMSRRGTDAVNDDE